MPLDATRFQIDIVAADRTAQAFQSAERRLRGFQAAQAHASQAMSAGYSALARALAPLAAAITVAATAQKIWAAGMKAADIGEQAEQLALTTDQLQAYRFVAAQAGVTNEQLDSSMMRLVKAMGAASGGSDEMIAKFDRLGVKLLDADGNLRKPSAVLPELARGLLNVSSETERNALMMDFMGKSGSRMATTLETIARGNDEVVRSAKAQGAIISPENIAKWDGLSDALKRSQVNSEALMATLTAPAAHAAADLMDRLAKNTAAATVALNALPKDASFMQKLDAIFGGRTGNNTMGGYRLSTPAETAFDKLDADRAALNKLVSARQGASGSTAAMLDEKIARQTELVQKQEAAYRQLAKTQENEAARVRLINDGLPAIDNPKTGGKGQPKGDAATKAGETEAARQLRETQKAMDDLFDSIEKVRKDSEGVMDRFGDGAAYAARETAELNEMLQMGYLDAGTHARALEDVTRNADDMGRAYRGAAGGADAFIAGFEQSLVDLERANSLFNLGRQSIDFWSDSLDILAGTSNRTFGQMAVDFAMMIAKWELAAQASNIWNMVRGKGPTDQGLFGSILSGIGDLFSGGGSNVSDAVYNGGGSLTYGGRRAGGGGVNPGSWYMVGERGPEPFIPHAPGTIIPNRALGGGAPAIVNIYNQGGGEVRKEQRTGGDGQSITDIFITAIENKLARNLDNGTGAQSKVLQGRYGIAPVGRR